VLYRRALRASLVVGDMDGGAVGCWRAIGIDRLRGRRRGHLSITGRDRREMKRGGPSAAPDDMERHSSGAFKAFLTMRD
jgi:hypothetical protein